MDLDFIFADKTQEENLANIKPSRSVTCTQCTFSSPPKTKQREKEHTVFNIYIVKGHLSSEN